MNATDFYEVLEIEEEAKPEEIRRAYFRLAKIYHPDLSTNENEDEDTTERFLALQQAYEVLSDNRRRLEYDEMRRPGGPQEDSPDATKPKKRDDKDRPEWARGPSLNEERDARKAFMAVQNLIESDDYERAIEVLRAIVKTVPNEPEYESAYGYVLALTGQNLHKARDHCRRAVQADPYNADFQAHMGYVYMQAGLGKTSQECFARALNLDSSNPIARRFHKDEGGGEGGIIGKIRGLFGG